MFPDPRGQPSPDPGKRSTDSGDESRSPSARCECSLESLVREIARQAAREIYRESMNRMKVAQSGQSRGR
jgi:hypothetical protein